jgi:hypothetical protein
MVEHRPGEGGAANTPPFPRLVEGTDPSPAESGSHEREPLDARPAPLDEPPPARSRPADDDPLPPPFGADPAEPPPRRSRGSRLDRRAFGRRAGATLRQRTESGLHRGFGRVADRLEETAERLERLADDRLQGPGARARAGEVAQSAAGWIDDLADYLRASDADRLRADLERQVSDKPVQTLLLAVAAGWVAGKIMR